ncbi:histidine kinase [Hyphomicrobium sp. NDB2Meth4]|uniref:sensor histidine kinase n=1 Tax=Hyphomicrobium sp. NDB2Meth4 TaxID=1892846 RepID=UPI000931BD32|nr:histidine kinase [Hyphomicrobium sp. NDB2Meth4]
MLQWITRWSRKLTDLKAALLLRIAFVSAGCLVAAALYAVHEARQEEIERAAAAVDIIGRQLDMQLLRISTQIDTEKRFPDWDTVIDDLSLAGQCIELHSPAGELVRSHCVGTPAAGAAAPRWFVWVWERFYGDSAAAKRHVGEGANSRGTLVVTSTQSAVASRAWKQVRQLTVFTALIALVLASLVYLALARALKPADQLIGGLEQMTAGNFSMRLPSFRLKELDHISKASNALAAKIEAMLDERNHLTQRLVVAQEEERRELARELHDEYGQNLAAITALAASMEKSLEVSEPDIASEASSVGRIAGGMLHSLRGTLRRLRPADVDEIGLDEALRQLVSVWNSRRRPATQFALHLPEEIGPLPPATAMHVFRIAQEGLTNAVRHAEASKVDLRLEHIISAGAVEDRRMRLTIEDDGKASRLASGKLSPGMGLSNMRERVDALGGTIDFQLVAGGGLRVQVTIPTPAPVPEVRLS